MFMFKGRFSLSHGSSRKLFQDSASWTRQYFSLSGLESPAGLPDPSKGVAPTVCSNSFRAFQISWKVRVPGFAAESSAICACNQALVLPVEPSELGSPVGAATIPTPETYT